ncbi:MAG: DnaJ domain-containing protein [Myxococcota bacterium]
MAENPLDQLDYYTLLGVKPNADLKTIRIAFRQFARKYHPDRFARDSADRRAQATVIYRRGSEGLQVLTDPDARKLYDRALRQGILRLTAEQRDGAARAFQEHERRKSRPSNPTFASMQAKTAYEEGRVALEMGDRKAAWRAFRMANELEPGNALVERFLYQVERELRGQ